MKRKETLKKGLVEALIRATNGLNKDNTFHLLKSPHLSFAMKTNFQKLRYFGVISKTDKSGYWRILPIAFEFIAGTARLPKSVEVEKNKVVSVGYETVSLDDVWKEDKFWLQKEDYINQRPKVKRFVPEQMSLFV